MKRIKLEKMNTIMGRPFRNAVRDDDGNAIMDIRRDSEKNPIKQVPRDSKGEAISGAIPEIVYQARTEAMGKEALLELLKSLYLNLEAGGYKMTRLDTISGLKMFQNIWASKDGFLELDEDVHDWISKKLQDENIGVKIFGVNLAIIEDAVNNFERLHEPKSKNKEGE